MEKKRIMKFGVLLIVLIVLIHFLIGSVVKTGVDNVQSVVCEMSEMIGETYTLNNEKLKIVNYSIFTDTYILENGLEVSKVLVDKQLKEDEKNNNQE